MIRNPIRLLATGCWLLATLPTFAAEPARRESYTDRYAVLSEHNIFLRDRSRPARRTSSTTQPQRNPEQLLVLSGVVMQDEEVWAYVEDLSTSRIARVGIGDALGPGKIADIDIDAIDYEHAGEHRWINVGSDLTGAPIVRSFAPSISSASPTTAVSVASTTQPADSAAINALDPNLSMEERLRLRRIQELKGK